MTVTREELEAAIRLPTESLDRDFKREFGWARPGARLELGRDITCLANRAGGTIIVGVEESGGRLVAAGLQPGDTLPDATEVNKLLAKYFAPQPIVEILGFDVDGLAYGAVIVSEFADAPHICIATGNDENGDLVLREGDLYRRSDRMECRRSDPASMSGLIDSAVTKRAASYRAMSGLHEAGSAQRPVPPIDESGITLPAPAASTLAAEASVSQRAVQFQPATPPGRLSLKELKEAIAAATVFNRMAHPHLPRGIDLARAAPNEVTRMPDGITVEHSTDIGGGEQHVVLAASRTLRVEIQETLWEDLDFGPEAKRLDISSMVAFVVASLIFGKRLYASSGAFSMEVGILRPIGRLLVAEPGRFNPFMTSYVATSPVDVWVTTTHSPVDLTPEGIRDATRSTMDELTDYFGYRMSDEAFSAQFAYVRTGYLAGTAELLEEPAEVDS